MPLNPLDYRYVVKLRGRACAAFTYVADAYGFIESDHARKAYLHPGQGTVPLYSIEDYTIEDAVQERPVVGMTSHHNAILAAINRGH